MAANRVIVDTGPLVAMLNRRDAAHAICYRQGGELPRPLLTTWPVIAEAAWLLRKTPGGVSGLLQFVSQGLVHCYPLDASAALWMDTFLQNYADLNPQLADASLMYVAEREGIETIFTLDRRDFLVFRLPENKPLRLLP